MTPLQLINDILVFLELWQQKIIITSAIIIVSKRNGLNWSKFCLRFGMEEICIAQVESFAEELQCLLISKHEFYRKHLNIQVCLWMIKVGRGNTSCVDEVFVSSLWVQKMRMNGYSYSKNFSSFCKGKRPRQQMIILLFHWVKTNYSP